MGHWMDLFTCSVFNLNILLNPKHGSTVYHNPHGHVCRYGNGTYSVYMRKDEDTTLNAATMCLANNSISIIAGLTVMMAVFSVMISIRSG